MRWENKIVCVEDECASASYTLLCFVSSFFFLLIPFTDDVLV